MRRDAPLAAAVAVFVALAWGFVAQPAFVDPDGASWAAAWLRALAAAAAVGLALVGVGGLVRRVLNDDGDASDDVVLGLAVAGPTLGAFAAAGALGAGSWAFTGLGVLALALRRPGRGPALAGWLVGAGIAAAIALGGLAAAIALAPPVDTDELFWHLAAPARLLRGDLVGGLLDPVSSRPLPLQLVHAALATLGGTAAVRLFHVGVAGALAWSVAGAVHDAAPEVDDDGRARGALAALALVFGSWSVLDELGLAHDNLVVALAIAVAARAALRGGSGAVGLALGAALAIKYTAVGAALGVGVLAVWRRWGDPGLPRAAGTAAALAVAVVAPWPVRNALAGLHPLFPYAGWPDAGFGYVWTEKYGLGHGPLALLRAPWDLVVNARTDGFQGYLGRVHPLWLVALPPAAWRAVWDRRARAIALAGVVAFVAWFGGMQWVRHLIPAAPLFALAVGVTAARLPPRWLGAAAIAWALTLPPQAVDLVRRAADGLPVLTGATSTADWREARVAAAAAAAWVNTNTPPDAKVALLFAGEVALVDRPTVLGSVEDHTPSRWWVWHHGDHALTALRDAGVRYVLVQRTSLLRQTYPFVPADVFADQLEAPPKRLRALLAAEATEVYASGRYSVWDLRPLDAPGAPR